MEVTARKWRPQVFEDFVGQEHVILSLKNAIKKKKIGHAYLLSGPRGTGKTSTARVFAKALNCLEGGPIETPCGKCKNCVEITQGNSVDVIELDGASNRGIDEIRSLRDNIQFLPSHSNYKIYIIDEVHMLTDAAFNALLKTLEEPPSHVIFLLATTDPHKVKITIRSRCQHFRLKRISNLQIAEQLEKILKESGIAYEKDAVTLIARAADGSMRDSQSLLDQCVIYSENNLTVDKVKEIIGSVSSDEYCSLTDIFIAEDTQKLSEFIARLYSEGEDISFFVEGMAIHMRNILLAKSGIANFEGLEESYFEKLKSYGTHFSNFQIHRLMDLFLNLHKELKTTEKERFVLENVFYQALDYKNFIHLSALLKKITELEKNLSEGSSYQIIQEPREEKKKAETLSQPIKKESKEEKITPSSDFMKEEKQPEPSVKKVPETPDEIWKSLKARISEKSPKLAAALNNVRSFEYRDQNIFLEFLSSFEEGFIKNDSQLILKMKDFFAKFNISVKEIKTFVKDAGIGAIKDPVEFIKEKFKGVEI